MEKQPDITIQYVDEIRCKIIAAREILYNLKAEYSFYANGYKFHPKFKQGLWDGRISMIDGKGLFYNGLLKSLLKYCKAKGLTIKVEDIKKHMPDIIEDDYIKTLSSYVKFSPYDYQQTSVKEALSKRKLLILSPTSSGKSLIIYLLYRHCVNNNLNLLITVPSTSLCEQLYSDFESYVSDDHKVEDYTAKLYGGQDKSIEKLVYISTWQTCSGMSPEWLSQFDFYICDEAHQGNAKELSSIIDNLPGCRYRIGLTGTLNGSNIHEIEMHARFGDIFKMVTTKELIERGIVTDININMVKLSRPKKEVEFFHAICKNEYQREIDWLINSEERNNYILKLASELEGNTLMLFNRVEGHGLKLYEELKDICDRQGKTLHLIYGNVKTLDREKIRKQIDSDNELVGKKLTINGKIYCFRVNENLKLTNGLMKNILDINKDDDIDYEWLVENEDVFKDFKR